MATGSLAEEVLKNAATLKILGLRMEMAPAGKSEEALLLLEDILDQLRVHAESMLDAGTVTRWRTENSSRMNKFLLEEGLSVG